MRTVDTLPAQFAGILFLSIQAQDFIEENKEPLKMRSYKEFLSIQAQDFIEDRL